MNRELLQTLFRYRKGLLFWAVNKGKIKKGSIAGTLNKYGYLQVQINKKIYKVHRIIYIMHYGKIPKDLVIDHINRDKLDNKIENLRAITQAENTFNSNAKGYSWDKEKKKWCARIRVNNKQIFLGRFDNEDDARLAYLEAKDALHLIGDN